MYLRLVRVNEPFEVRENMVLRQRLMQLTYGTHDRGRGFVFLPSEAQALYAVLAHKTFLPQQLDQIEQVLRIMDPDEDDSLWDDHYLRTFVERMRMHTGRTQWIDQPICQLHTAMRAQGASKKFRLWLCRAALVAFLYVDFLPTEPEYLFRLVG